MIALLRLELALLVLRLRRLIMVKNLQFIQLNLIDDTPWRIDNNCGDRYAI